jgi:hypothetical protein
MFQAELKEREREREGWKKEKEGRANLIATDRFFSSSSFSVSSLLFD